MSAQTIVRRRVPPGPNRRPSPAAKWMLVVGVLAVGTGAAVAINAVVGLAVTGICLALIASAAPAGLWAGIAIVASLTFRGLVTVHALPGVATFADIPISWMALSFAFVRRRPGVGRIPVQVKWLAGLAGAIGLSWVFHDLNEPLRPVAYLALLGEPFALLGALLLDPPTPRMRRALIRVLSGVLLVQLPVMAWQVLRFGIGDPVEGTLYGAGGGTKVMSGVMTVGAIWFLSRKDIPKPARWAAGGIFLLIPVVAKVFQVVGALPAGVLGLSSRGRTTRFFLAVAATAIAFWLLVAYAPPVYIQHINQATSGEGGKKAAATVVVDAVTADPSSFLFGRGPAETVSRTAFLTTTGFERTDSPLTALHLHPAEYAVASEVLANQNLGYHTLGHRSSLNSGLSSALGVLGDLGVLGAVMYAGLLASVFLAVRRRRSAEASAAAAGWAMFALLGVIFDWWEQPAFGLFIAVLTALALTADAGRPSPERAVPSTAAEPEGDTKERPLRPQGRV